MAPFNLSIVRKSRLTELLDQVLTLQKDIKNAIAFIKSIEAKTWNISYSSNESESTNELAKSLLKMRASLAEFSMQEEERNWVAVGLAMINDTLRLTTSINKLTETITINLTNYLNANQGAIFILNDADPNNNFLEMKGLYAYNKKKYFNQVVELGEGLVGQCFLEGELTCLSEVPGSYVKITSGLGEATPRFVVLVPLKSNKKTVGVFEVASFQVLKPYQLDFLSKASEAIAATILSTQAAEHTAKLLKDSEMMTAQLRHQEEAMKQNLEKITATQETLQRQNNELDLAKKEIESQQEKINLIQKGEMELVESKLKAQEMIHQTIITKLKDKIKELQARITSLEKIETHLN